MRKLFALGIPTLNRYDLLQHTLEMYAVDFKNIEIHVVDNGRQGIRPPHNVIVHEMPENMGVASSWNFLCRQIFRKHSVAIILNDDIYWGKKQKEVEQFVRMFFSSKNLLCASTKTWCNFAIHMRCFYSILGVDEYGKNFYGFDEAFFPAYFEDNDYARRIFLQAGQGTFKSEFLDPVIYRNSMTIERDRSVNDNFKKNSDYYIRKWGGMPGQEKFSAAFDGKFDK